ncbi:hypothetical protein EOM75_11760 [Candidatus Falkowbacteria bacterium]|nr:hypothetical protein [Candidatus Falkowbacteria bacterium]
MRGAERWAPGMRFHAVWVLEFGFWILFVIWNLEFGIWNLFVIWILELGIYFFTPRSHPTAAPAK